MSTGERRGDLSSFPPPPPPPTHTHTHTKRKNKQLQPRNICESCFSIKICVIFHFVFFFYTLHYNHRVFHLCLCRLLHLLANFSNLHFAYRQTVWTQIRLLVKKTKQTTIVVIGSLRVKGYCDSFNLSLFQMTAFLRKWFI